MSHMHDSGPCFRALGRRNGRRPNSWVQDLQQVYQPKAHMILKYVPELRLINLCGAHGYIPYGSKHVDNTCTDSHKMCLFLDIYHILSESQHGYRPYMPC